MTVGEGVNVRVPRKVRVTQILGNQPLFIYLLF